jgi:hypothetical protein
MLGMPTSVAAECPFPERREVDTTEGTLGILIGPLLGRSKACLSNELHPDHHRASHCSPHSCPPVPRITDDASPFALRSTRIVRGQQCAKARAGDRSVSLQLPGRGGSQPLAGSSPTELSRLLAAPPGAYPASGRCPGRRRRRAQVGRAVRRRPLPVLVHHWAAAQAGSSSGPVSSRSVSARRVSSVRCPPVGWPSGTGLSGRLASGRPASSRLVSARPSCGVRPVSGQPAVALGPPVRQDLHGWSGLGSAWLAAYPSGSVDGGGGLDAGDAAEVVGRPGGSRGSRTSAGSRSG